MNSHSQVKDWTRNYLAMLQLAIDSMGLDVTIIRSNETEVELSNGSIVYIRSLTSKIRGLSPDLIICDDLLDEEMNITFEEAERIFRGVILGTRQEHTKVLYVGTILRQGYILDKIRTAEIPNFHGASYPAILDEGRKIVRWPEKRSWKYLMEQKAINGSYLFEIEYQLNPLSDELALVPKRLIDSCKDESISIHDSFEGTRVMGVDLQISTSSSADYSVFVTLAVSGEGKYHLVHMDRNRGMGYAWQLNRIKQLHAKYQPQLIMVESNSFQRVLAQMLQEEYLPIEESVTGLEKHDMQIGIPSLRQIFESRQIVIPWKDSESREMFQPLIQELAAWQFVKDKGKFVSKARHDDTTMALWKAIQAALKYTYSGMKLLGSI